MVGRNARQNGARCRGKQGAERQCKCGLSTGRSVVDGEVRGLADEFRQKYDHLDVLVNNAGALFNTRQETVDGYEMTFALNHLSYFLLTNLLLDMLKASAPSRIVNVSSEAHQSGHINFDDLQSQNYGFQGMQAYSQSKLANVLFTDELARRLTGTGVTANALHPGLVASGFGHNNGRLFDLIYKVVDLFAISPEDGAQTIIYLASSPEVRGVTGKYWIKNKVAAASTASGDEVVARRLWDVSLKLTDLPQPATV